MRWRRGTGSGRGAGTSAYRTGIQSGLEKWRSGPKTRSEVSHPLSAAAGYNTASPAV